jgi:signal transduction histidine kinase
MKMSLMKKLSLAFLLAVLGSIILVSLISNYLISKEFNKYLINQHNEKIKYIIKVVEDQYNKQRNFSDINQGEIQRFAETQGLYIEIKDLNKNTVYSTGNSLVEHKNLMKSMIGSIIHDFSGMNFEEYIENTHRLSVDNKDIGSIKIGHFGTSYLSSSSITFIRTLNYSFVLSAIVALAFGPIISIIISKQLSKPLIKITETSNKMRNGNLEVRAVVNTNTKEIDALSNSINYLAETLSAQEMLRKRLTSDMAHELRTPLTTLKTHIEAFIDGIWEPTTERFEIFYEEINRLTKLVDNLHNLAKLEQLNINLSKSDVNLSIELEKILDTFKPLYNKEHYELNSSIIPDIHALVDKDKFKQIMNNLLSNSYNYLKPKGKVDIVLMEQNNNIIIKVIDNGIGIPERDLPYIFERFYRSDLSRNKYTGGSGIGLTITKAFVEAHDGKIYVESSLNVGTTFTIELPSIQR